jgi:PAS domain S-box-containing protein
VAFCIGATAVLWSQVLAKLGDLATANSDSAQWTLSQVEVEYIQFLNAVISADAVAPGVADAEALAHVRRRFDVFYSRHTIVSSGTLYRALADFPAFGRAVAETQAFLSAAVPRMDGSDEDLRAALPTLRSEAEAIRDAIRSIPIEGIGLFAARADDQRERIAGLLFRVAAVTIVLIVALLIVAFILVGLNRALGRRAREIAITGQRLETVVETALDAIIVADTSGRVREYNRAAADIFGWSRDEALGRPMTDLMIPKHHRAAHEAGMKRYLASGETRVIGKGRVQLEARRADGSIFPVELSISSARGPEGEIFVSFLRDISRRVAAEHELREARDRALEGERAKARFLAVMSHEMRTPLNGLLGSMELLEATRLDAAQSKYVSLMRSSGALLLDHVNDVLDISSLDASPQSFLNEPIDLRALLSEVMEGQRAVAADRGNQIESVLTERVPERVLGDIRRLRQALLNLVGNALKFTRNGRVTLGCDAHPMDAGEVAIEFRVADTGIGIPKKDQSRIFNDFVTLDASYRRKTGGTGLGLGITRRLISAMGGEIGVESEEGAGSVFWIRLPMRKVDPALKQAGPDGTPSEALRSGPRAIGTVPSRHALIVEDNEINRIVLRDFLKKLGHTADEAHDGDEGVRFAELRRYDLIFMDISMPRLSGVEATRAIRSGSGPSRTAPIIAITAHALPEETREFYEAGIDSILTKPISAASFARAIASVTGSEDPAEGEARRGDGPAVDESVLIQLRESLPADVFSRLREKFIAETDAEIAGLPTLLANTMADEARERIHRLSGSAGTFGATLLHEALLNAERCLKKDPAGANRSEIVVPIAAAWDRTRKALEKEPPASDP